MRMGEGGSRAELEEAAGHGVVGPGHVGRLQHLHDLAVDHEAGHVGDTLDLFQAVRDHHDGEPAGLLQPHDDVLDVLGRDRVQRTGGLVQQQHLGRQINGPVRWIYLTHEGRPAHID